MIQTQKAHLLDVVEILEDLPEYNIKKGEKGTVVEVFDEPEEAYMVEFVDESGTSSRLADWLKPEQIKTSDQIAKEIFERGILLLSQYNPLAAEKEFQRAIEIDPSYIRVLHNSFIKSLEGVADWQRVMTGMRLVLRLNPTYNNAKQNLAIAFLNYGIEKMNEGDISFALEIFYRALGLATTNELLSSIKKNIASAFISLGIQSYKKGDLESSLRFM